MDRTVAEEIFAACERAIAELSGAENAIRRVADPEERSHLMRALGLTIAEILGSVRASAVQQYPDLEPAPELGEPDTTLDGEGQAAVSLLTVADIEFVDRALLAQCAPSWRKVARVVGAAMHALPEKLEHVPDGYFAQRVVFLVGTGKLESEGNLQYMRFSEVRLPHG